jgi:hypothetical protein
MRPRPIQGCTSVKEEEEEEALYYAFVLMYYKSDRS